MDNIEKALQELAKAVERNDTVERVKVTITLVKPRRGADGKPSLP